MVMIVRSQKTAEGDVYGNNSFNVWFNSVVYVEFSFSYFFFFLYNIVTIDMVNYVCV